HAGLVGRASRRSDDPGRCAVADGTAPGAASVVDEHCPVRDPALCHGRVRRRSPTLAAHRTGRRSQRARIDLPQHGCALRLESERLRWGPGLRRGAGGDHCFHLGLAVHVPCCGGANHTPCRLVAAYGSSGTTRVKLGAVLVPIVGLCLTACAAPGAAETAYGNGAQPALSTLPPVAATRMPAVLRGVVVIEAAEQY